MPGPNLGKPQLPMSDTSITWPDIESSYEDEFGRISADVNKAARELWPQAQKFSLLTIRDAHAGMRLMMKAAAKVSRRKAEFPAEEIHDLKGYLFKVFKNIVFSELEKEAGHRKFAAVLEHKALDRAEDLTQELERKILIDELIQRMDPQTRSVFELLVLGYTFEEIATRTNGKANVLRSRFSKRVRSLSQRIRQEVEDAGFP
jgi:DNA-directed RNA polymerase specialized sigma24 family protein